MKSLHWRCCYMFHLILPHAKLMHSTVGWSRSGPFMLNFNRAVCLIYRVYDNSADAQFSTMLD